MERRQSGDFEKGEKQSWGGFGTAIEVANR